MSKRIISLLLCAFLLIPALSACASKEQDTDPGAYITMYLTNDIFDFDPANAYYNKEAINVVGLMFDTLFKLTDNGDVKKSLVKKYVIKEDKTKQEYTMELTLNEAYWSNGIALSAEDVVYAWKRLINSNNSFAAASLLYDIKNARVIKEGGSSNISIDDIGIEAVEQSVVRITFEGPIDYDQFLLNLTNVATAPLLENYVQKNPDWAKKPSTMVTSGAFKLGKIRYDAITVNGKELKIEDDNAITADGEVKTKRDNIAKSISYFYLERNIYYYRDTKRDSIRSSVTPYRILVDCTKSDEQLLSEYKEGKLFYIGNIPLSLRNDEYVKKNAEVTNALSTFVCYLNENALIADGAEGKAIFADVNVRKALSLAIDRTAIANAVVYAQAATGLVCPGIFDVGTSKDFRKIGGDLIAATADLTAAKSALSTAGINASSYSFSIKVAAYDNVNIAIAEMIAKAWGPEGLGFKVTVTPVYAVENNDYFKEVDQVSTDVCDDLFIESIQRNKYEVIAFDYNAFSADAYSMLSSFAMPFSGMSTVNKETGAEIVSTHSTGYNSTAYNNLMEAVYYIPYFASLTEDSVSFLNLYETAEQYRAAYQTVKDIYAQYNITPTTSSSKWNAQKATLLHEAEKLLTEELPVIPVLFNQNATLTGSELKSVSATYYIPSYFRKTNLKNYKDYTYLDKDGKPVSIFADFPGIVWEKAGK